MLRYLRNQYKLNFVSADERTIWANRNTAFSLIFRILSILISLVLIPMTIRYVNAEQFGIWLTLSSIINWFSFFDLGMGNGLKNKVAESNALGYFEKSKSYVSTIYALLSGVTLTVFLISYFLNNYINWNRILNVPLSSEYNLNNLVLIVLVIFCIQFVLQLINVILTACHESAKVSFITLIGQILIFTTIYFLIHNTESSLLYLILALAGIPIVVLSISSIILFTNKYKFLAPSFKMINLGDAKSLLGLGGIFFIIQMGQLVLYQTDNIIISRLFGPSSVTVFNICYKLFSVIVIVFTIFITPYWSAFTDAYAKKEYVWINKTFKKLQRIWLLTILATLILLFLSPWLLDIWVGKKIQVPFKLSFAISVYIILSCWHMMCCYLLNGINKIRLQLYMYVGCFILNIPLCILFGNMFGIIGVTISNILIFGIMGLVFYIQCNKILSGTAKGVWNQ